MGGTAQVLFYFSQTLIKIIFSAAYTISFLVLYTSVIRQMSNFLKKGVSSPFHLRAMALH